MAARADLVRATGLGPVWRRVRAEGQLASLGDSARDNVYEQIWTGAAEACSAGIDKLAPGLFELTREGRRTRVYHQTVEIDDPVTLHMALDKALVHRLMAEEGIPSPERVEWTVEDPEPAIAFLNRVGGPCVVKPAAGTGGGHGVTPGIASAGELMRARIHAATGGERLLIERQADGDVYRLLFLDGELLDVIRSVPAAVIGDGRGTIEELIARENRRRAAAGGAAGLSLLGMNLDTVLTLRRAGLTLSSVLPAGRRVRIREATNNNAAEDNVTWRGEIADEVIDTARAASAVVGLRLAGIDIVAPTVAVPLQSSGGVITEVNGTPGLHHHYLVADRDAATRVAIPILGRLLSERLEHPRDAPAGEISAYARIGGVEGVEDGVRVFGSLPVERVCQVQRGQGTKGVGARLRERRLQSRPSGQLAGGGELLCPAPGVDGEAPEDAVRQLPEGDLFARTADAAYNGLENAVALGRQHHLHDQRVATLQVDAADQLDQRRVPCRCVDCPHVKTLGRHELPECVCPRAAREDRHGEPARHHGPQHCRIDVEPTRRGHPPRGHRLRLWRGGGEIDVQRARRE